MKYKNVLIVISVLLNISFIAKYGVAFVKDKSSNRVEASQSITLKLNAPLYLNKTDLFKTLPMTNKTIIFLGDSITDNCEWNELLQISSAQNRGIAGDITNGVLNRLDSVIKANPNKLFLMIGVNDLGINRNQEDIVKDYDEILSVLTKSLPNTKIYVQSILPTNVKITKYIGDNKNIIALNKNIKLLSDKYHLSYIDLYSKMIDNDGNLNKDYTVDGLHLNGNGYLVWKDAIKDYL